MPPNWRARDSFASADTTPMQDDPHTSTRFGDTPSEMNRDRRTAGTLQSSVKEMVEIMPDAPSTVRVL